MTRISLLETAHEIVRRHLNSDGIAIDATLGNGHDTVFLAQCVGETGHVYGFDIQTQALDNTRQRLQQRGLEERVTLFHASHACMQAYIPEQLRTGIQAIMFNLGYLPGADKSVITQTQTTLEALDEAMYLLADYGVITVLAYPGHAGGDQEAEKLADWCARLDKLQFTVESLLSSYQQASAPRLFVIRKQTDLI